MSNHAKYHPVKPCGSCGRTRRIMSRGLCCTCYLAARDSEQPGYIEKRRANIRNYMRTYKRDTTTSEYIDPMRAIRILVAFFEANEINIDDLCNYIAMSRAMHKREMADETELGRKRPRKHWARSKRCLAS